MNCLNCDKELIGKWQKKFCSRTCSSIINNQRFPKRGPGQSVLCRNCGQSRRTGKIYCSLLCQREFYRKQYIDRWLRGEESGGSSRSVSSIVRRHLNDAQQGACAICKLTEWINQPIPLVADHIDGNPENHRPDNLRLICGNCDMQTPTYKSKNAGNGRHYRRERYAQGLSY